MKNILSLLLSIVFCFCLTFEASAEEYKGQDTKSSAQIIKDNTTGCAPGAGYRMLQVNNVSCRINTGGDMWWDFENPMYEIPKGSNKTSMFAAGLWIGGIDNNDHLKLAAVRFRQGYSFSGGNDYWPGPLTLKDASITPDVCLQYDKLFFMSRDMVNEFLSNCDPETGIFDPTIDPEYTIPTEIIDWPAHADVSLGQSYYLAPFFDNDGDGSYDPLMGDYPYYDLNNELCPINYAGDPTYKPEVTMEERLGHGTSSGQQLFNSVLTDQVIKGDETLWWVFNDKGNIHTESTGDPIGFEIRAQAFGFASNDEINNMTFYSYEIINRSSYVLRDTYFSQWVDTDLGFAKDDYVGCDVLRGLGYSYNGKDIDGDGQYNAYGSQPPAIGVDFFQGPYLDPDGYDNPGFYGNGLLGPTYNLSNTPTSNLNCNIVSQDGFIIDLTYGPDSATRTEKFLVNSAAINGINFGNGIVDDERFGMRRFVYHNNEAGYMGDPRVAIDYYNFLRGIWKDNTKMKYGGNAHSSSGAEDIDTDFMFPGDSDPCLWGTKGITPAEPYWTEQTVGNPYGDRRFMQSAGPFTLQPGQVNYITVGIPWARATSGGPWGSVELLRKVDDKCQALFDNCFSVVNGPNAPDLTIRELDNTLVFYLTNRKTNDSGNNFGEKYIEVDPYLATLPAVVDTASNSLIYMDSAYRFEGYIVYQLIDGEASIADVGDQSKVREIFQCDVKNGVTKLINYDYDSYMEANVPTAKVNGVDAGISHTFTITKDAFTESGLINHKTYYFTVVAYAYNEYMKYSDQPDQWILGKVGIDGQKTPFLSGRKNIKTYEAIPHIPIGGVKVNSNYGDQPAISRIQGRGNGGFTLMMEDYVVDEILSKDPIKYRLDENGNLELTTFSTTEIEYTGVLTPLTNLGDEDYPIAYEIDYKKNYGPLAIKVIDPLNVINGEFELRFDSMYYQTMYDVSGDTRGADTAGKMVNSWVLKDLNTNKKFKSDTTTSFKNEQIFFDLGLSITLEQTYFAKPYSTGTFNDGNELKYTKAILSDNNGLLYSDIVYADSTKKWLTGVIDIDEYGPYNWIRSGESADPNDAANNDYSLGITSNGNVEGTAFDPQGVYESVAGGWWAPYHLSSLGSQHVVAPGFSVQARSRSLPQNVYSVDIVFTSDKSKWTRCPVIEMCADNTLSEGGQDKYFLRKAPSVDKDGNPADVTKGNNFDDPESANYISATGMGWFPGYAINIETGERLNMMFGEDSWLVGENGRDMKWNPTPNVVLDMYYPPTVFTNPPSSALLFGGKHYIYVFGANSALFGGVNPTQDSPAYDAGVWAHHTLSYNDLLPSLLLLRHMSLYANVMWVGIPIIDKNYYSEDQSYLDNQAKVRIRINKPYERYYSGTKIVDTIMVPTEENNRFFPAFKFSTESIATETLVQEIRESELDLISAVPNPYYGLSDYDANQLENNIKIINLPHTCTITIFNAGGQFIRQFTKSSEQTYQIWDLKNSKNIPIASGMYIIHVSAPGIGERTIKWFGQLRPVDLNTF
ncbi:T9SS type A sorting domain-containing protein [Bacteroidales bacterium OttesenSCG-928-K03]|nr:T9SS type A sorting domain-containing protein [Odoribacter sp. OttesenSCG-928-L07]MDL2239014.1 T9SS type A sorting domain-containing protein [Bacteroidales bacterium OttesenSCG-928-L14]MDL2242148.1 T9SS type A sorting domain-containing protein [Bacteroidales bacterium OttesenSCG-928-K03]